MYVWWRYQVLSQTGVAKHLRVKCGAPVLVVAAAAAALPEAAAGAGSGCRRRRRAATERPDPSCRPAKHARRVLKSKSRVCAPQTPRHALILRDTPALAQGGEGAAAANEEGSDDDITAFATASARDTAATRRSAHERSRDLEVRSRHALTLRFDRQFVRIGKDLLCAPTTTRARRESVASPSARFPALARDDDDDARDGAARVRPVGGAAARLLARARDDAQDGLLCRQDGPRVGRA